MKALFIFTPTESKRLIGKAVAQMEEVKTAFNKANILISHGSTALYALEEILGKEELLKLMNPAAFLSGIVTRGTLCSTLGSEKPPIVLLQKGVVTPPPLKPCRRCCAISGRIRSSSRGPAPLTRKETRASWFPIRREERLDGPSEQFWPEGSS